MTARPDKSEPPPVLLTKAEALAFAADRLERMARDREIAALILGCLEDSPPPDAELGRKLAEFRDAMREPELQARAIRDAARAIRELALEERLMSARVQAADKTVRNRGGGAS